MQKIQMKNLEFTHRVLSPNPHRERSTAWRAGQLVVAMEGCNIPDVISALAVLERDTAPTGVGDPARWLSHFAGLESSESGKAMTPWIEILHSGMRVATTAAYRRLLRSE